MTLPLELGQVSDPVARRALEQISLKWVGGVPGPVGPTGPAGPPGPATFLVGTGAPGAGDGVDGAVFLDANTGRLYGPKAGGAWPGTPLGIIVQDTTTYTRLSSGA